MGKLKYETVGDVVIDIDLHNGYTVRAIAKFNTGIRGYNLTFYIKDNTIEKFSLVDYLDHERIFLKENYKTIKPAILKCVSNLHKDNGFNRAINDLNFETRCFDIGYEEETERIKNDNKDGL